MSYNLSLLSQKNLPWPIKCIRVMKINAPAYHQILLGPLLQWWWTWVVYLPMYRERDGQKDIKNSAYYRRGNWETFSNKKINLRASLFSITYAFQKFYISFFISYNTYTSKFWGSLTGVSQTFLHSKLNIFTGIGNFDWKNVFSPSFLHGLIWAHNKIYKQMKRNLEGGGECWIFCSFTSKHYTFLPPTSLLITRGYWSHMMMVVVGISECLKMGQFRF